MAHKTRSKDKRGPQLTETNRALLFSVFKRVKLLVPAVKRHKMASVVQNQFCETFGGDVSLKAVRRWIKRWEENSGDAVLLPKTRKKYNCKRRRIATQIGDELKKGKSTFSTAFEPFADGGVPVTVSFTTVWRAAHELGLKPAAAKKRRIIEFSPHHAKAAKTVCEAHLVMEKEFIDAGRSWSGGIVFEDEKGWKGTLASRRRIWVPQEDVATSNIQSDNNR